MSAATSLLTPATSSLTLISIGWLKPNFMPGTCSVKSLSISSIKASRVKPGRHSSWGLSMVQTSVWCTPITSLAISGRPVLQ